MEKIIFENLPSRNTPVNADNLNQLQNNVEQEINNFKNEIGKIINLFGEIGGQEGATGYVEFCGHLTAAKISKNTWRFDMQANSYIDHDITQTFKWGIKISMLNDLLVPYGIRVDATENINYTGFWKATSKQAGDAHITSMDYGTTFEHNGDFLVPARYYQTDGAIGGYPPSMFPENHLWEMTFFLNEV